MTQIRHQNTLSFNNRINIFTPTFIDTLHNAFARWAHTCFWIQYVQVAVQLFLLVGPRESFLPQLGVLFLFYPPTEDLVIIDTTMDISVQRFVPRHYLRRVVYRSAEKYIDDEEI